MKFMISWDIGPDAYKSAMDKFLSTGAPMPDGLSMIGRWHAPGSAQGWVLVETDDPTAVAQFVAEWSGLVDIQTTFVIEDDDAAAGIEKAL